MKLPKRLQGQTPSHARSRSQEKETAERIGGKKTPRSGAGMEKADVRLLNVARIEDKTTKHASFSVNAEHIEKLKFAVLGTEEIPIMKVELLSGAVEFFVIPGMYFDEVVEKLKHVNEDSDK